MKDQKIAQLCHIVILDVKSSPSGKQTLCSNMLSYFHSLVDLREFSFLHDFTHILVNKGTVGMYQTKLVV